MYYYNKHLNMYSHPLMKKTPEEKAKELAKERARHVASLDRERLRLRLLKSCERARLAVESLKLEALQAEEMVDQLRISGFDVDSVSREYLVSKIRESLATTRETRDTAIVTAEEMAEDAEFAESLTLLAADWVADDAQKAENARVVSERARLYHEMAAGEMATRVKHEEEIRAKWDADRKIQLERRAAQVRAAEMERMQVDLAKIRATNEAKMEFVAKMKARVVEARANAAVTMVSPRAAALTAIKKLSRTASLTTQERIQLVPLPARRAMAKHGRGPL
jgi:hypothetical protein